MKKKTSKPLTAASLIGRIDWLVEYLRPQITMAKTLAERETAFNDFCAYRDRLYDDLRAGLPRTSK